FFAALHHSRGCSSRDAAVVVDTSIPDVGHGGAIRIPTPRTILSVPMKTPTGAERVMEALATPHRVAGTLRFAEGLNMGARQLVILTSLLAERGIDPQRAFRVRWITTSGGYLNTGAFRLLGRTYARCGGRGRAPFEVREKHATQEVLLDEDGNLLVRPVPLLDLLGDEEGIARWPIWAEGIDPLGLGRPRFALGFEPD